MALRFSAALVLRSAWRRRPFPGLERRLGVSISDLPILSMRKTSKGSAATSWLSGLVIAAMLATGAFMVVRITLLLLTEGQWYDRLALAPVASHDRLARRGSLGL